jgi:DNA-binding winged helix-turn-helix (wHTH) protein
MREFPPFRLDTVNQCLFQGDGVTEERVLLAPKAFDVLLYLVKHPGRLVTHEELLNALWPKTYVQPEVLKSHIAAIRAVLGDDARKPMFIDNEVALSGHPWERHANVPVVDHRHVVGEG